MRLVAPPTLARTGRRLTFQRRLVTLCAWLMLFPNCGPLPQTSHTRGIETPNFVLRIQRCGLLQEGIKPNEVLPLKYMWARGIWASVAAQRQSPGGPRGKS